MNRRTFVVSSAGAAVIGATSPFSIFAQKTPDLETLLEVTRTPGLAARTPTATLLAGIREVGKSDPVTATTYFSAASLAKPVFAMAVRRLVREGRLDWKKPLQDYTPLGLTGEAAAITTENVLTHATGLVNWRFDAKDELSSAFTPGTRWQYSGEGYVLLQRVVEKLVDEPLGGYLNQKLLPSLGMTRSSFTWSPEIEKNAVAGHDRQGRLMEKSTAFYERNAYSLAEKAGKSTDKVTYDEMIALTRLPISVNPNVAGSLWTTIDDYFTFMQKSVVDMAAHPDEYTPRNRVNAKISWTLSWGVDSSLGAPGYFHWGDGPGVKNFVWIQPAKKSSAVIFTNSDHGASAYRWLLRRLLNADPMSPEWV